MKIEKIYLGDSYKLAALRLYFENEPSLIVENDKKLTNENFLFYVKNTFNVSYVTNCEG